MISDFKEEAGIFLREQAEQSEVGRKLRAQQIPYKQSTSPEGGNHRGEW